MLTAIALTLTAAADCVARGEYIIMEDDLMRVSIEGADEVQISVETMITDDRVPWFDGAGEVIVAGASVLAEGALRKGFYVFEDNVILRTGSTGLTISDAQFQSADTEIAVFVSKDAVYEDNIIFATAVISGPLEAIEAELPEDAIQLVPSPTCR